MSFGADSPDYKGAAEAQGKSSVDAINAQTLANRPNLTTPWGSMTWNKNQDGSWNGNMALSGPQQQALNDQMDIQAGRSSMAKGMLDSAGKDLSRGIDWAGFGALPNGEQARQDATNAAYDQAKSRLDPQWDQTMEKNRTQLLNEGLDPNSQAYGTQMDNLNRQKTDAYQTAQNAAVGQGLQAGQQSFNQGMQGRQQGISEAFQQQYGGMNALNAFLSGSQVGMPQMPSFSNAGAAQPTQYLQAAGDQGNFNSANNPMGDILGAAGKLGASGMFAFSDRRMKKAIRRLKTYALPGVHFAEWIWKHTGERGFGVIAQDVERRYPALVKVDPASGLKMVNYSFLKVR